MLYSSLLTRQRIADKPACTKLGGDIYLVLTGRVRCRVRCRACCVGSLCLCLCWRCSRVARWELIAGRVQKFPPETVVECFPDTSYVRLASPSDVAKGNLDTYCIPHHPPHPTRPDPMTPTTTGIASFATSASVKIRILLLKCKQPTLSSSTDADRPPISQASRGALSPKTVDARLFPASKACSSAEERRTANTECSGRHHRHMGRYLAVSLSLMRQML